MKKFGFSKKWSIGVALVASAICLLAMASSATAATHEEHFCWGKTVTGSNPCLGLNEGSIHRFVKGIRVTGVEHSVCAGSFLTGQEKACTGGANQSAYLNITPTEYSNYGRIFPNNGVQGETKVYGTIYWNDPPASPPPPPPSEWHSQLLGGTFTDHPDIASWGSNGNGVNVFGSGIDSAIWRDGWSGGGWTGWVSNGCCIVSAPAAVSWGVNRIDVVAGVAGGSVGHWYSSDNGANWSYDNLGGNIQGSPTISSWGPNHLDVVVRGTDNAIYRKAWNGGGWSEWQSIGCCIVSSPGATSWGPNRLDVVAVVAGGSLGHWYSGDGGATLFYDNLGGTFQGDPDIASWGSGRLDVFGIGVENQLWHKWWNGSAWNEWQPLGGSVTGGVGAVGSPTERLDVVARNLGDNSVVHWWWGP